MQNPQVHCNIDEKMFSITLFLTRLLAGSTLLYVCIGCLLFYREFLFNAAALSIPVSLGVGIVILEIFSALLLLLGWLTRWVAGILVAGTVFLSFVFFASNFNKVYVALLVLLIAALLPSFLLGPGRISLDFKYARQRVKKEFRG